MLNCESQVGSLDKSWRNATISVPVQRSSILNGLSLSQFIERFNAEKRLMPVVIS
jgi:hypothetical protein